MKEEGSGRKLKPQVTVGAAAKKSTKNARSSAERVPCLRMVPFLCYVVVLEEGEIELLLRWVPCAVVRVGGEGRSIEWVGRVWVA